MISIKYLASHIHVQCSRASYNEYEPFCMYLERGLVIPQSLFLTVPIHWWVWKVKKFIGDANLSWIPLTARVRGPVIGRFNDWGWTGLRICYCAPAVPTLRDSLSEKRRYLQFLWAEPQKLKSSQRLSRAVQFRQMMGCVTHIRRGLTHSSTTNVKFLVDLKLSSVDKQSASNQSRIFLPDTLTRRGHLAYHTQAANNRDQYCLDGEQVHCTFWGILSVEPSLIETEWVINYVIQTWIECIVRFHNVRSLLSSVRASAALAYVRVLTFCLNWGAIYRYQLGCTNIRSNIVMCQID